MTCKEQNLCPIISATLKIRSKFIKPFFFVFADEMIYELYDN